MALTHEDSTDLHQEVDDIDPLLVWQGSPIVSVKVQLTPDHEAAEHAIGVVVHDRALLHKPAHEAWHILGLATNFVPG